MVSLGFAVYIMRIFVLHSEFVVITKQDIAAETAYPCREFTVAEKRIKIDKTTLECFVCYIVYLVV